MINEKQKLQFVWFKYLKIVSIVTILFLCNLKNIFASEAATTPNKECMSEFVFQEIQQKTKPHQSVENLPKFRGGDESLMKYMANNIKYPEIASKAGIQGKVVVRFVVSETGILQDPQIIRSLSPECDAEVIRLVKDMPEWIPGTTKEGKAVPVYYTLPVSFKLPKTTGTQK